MRGKLEQTPMIIPSNGDPDSPPIVLSEDDTDSISSSSSDDEEQPVKPAVRRGDKAKFPVEAIRLGEKQGKPKVCGDSGNGVNGEAQRGRENKPRPDTAFSVDSSAAEKPPRLERERSPYASGPRDSRPKQNRYSSETLLSPSLHSPVAEFPSSPRSHSQRPSINGHDDGRCGSDRANTTSRSQRPSLDRRASAMPDLGRSAPVNSSHTRTSSGHYSSDEGEIDAARYRARAAQPAAEVRSPLVPAEVFSQRSRDHRTSLRNPVSPPRTPVASEYPKSHGLNREALLNGAAAAASLNSLLDHHMHQRRASPRPSPHASPNSSPYPSPPRTPPEPYRKQAFSSSKDNSPSSRPTTPTFVAHTSSKTLGADRMSYNSDQDGGSQRYPPRSRATSPLPSARRPEAALPKIDVRSPSPYAPNHAKSPSHEANDLRTPSRYRPAYATGSTTLQAPPPIGRQRSYSSLDSHRPKDLTFNPPIIRQSDIEYLSPTSENAPSSFRSGQQTTLALLGSSASDPDSRNPVSSLASSSQRSHSAMPVPDQGSSQSLAIVPSGSSRPRSRSTAPGPEIAYSDQRYPDPVKFPPCPHPKPMAGYRDWYSIIGCDSFTICRECRSRIFGHGYGRNFKRFDPGSATQEIQCAINDPWIRMACLASILKGSNDLSPVVSLCEENEDRSPCPQKVPAHRDWYYLRDPEAEANLADFRVCSHCAHSIYTLFPVLDRVFRRAEKMEDEPLLCSIRSADPVRFGQYVNHCEKAQQAALKAGRKYPDMSDFIWYHKKETVISECTRDQVLIGRDWHLHPQIPECTVCEECYYEVIRPEIRKGHKIAQQFSPIAKHINDGVSCTLYSPRMKEVFRIACEDDDLKYLKHNVMSRRELQIKIMALKMAVQTHHRDGEAQDELDHYMKKWQRLEKEKYADDSQ